MGGTHAVFQNSDNDLSMIITEHNHQFEYAPVQGTVIVRG
jgi:hypothetical protein